MNCQCTKCHKEIKLGDKCYSIDEAVRSSDKIITVTAVLRIILCTDCFETTEKFS